HRCRHHGLRHRHHTAHPLRLQLPARLVLRLQLCAGALERHRLAAGELPEGGEHYAGGEVSGGGGREPRTPLTAQH
ncbi:MAG: hypothetical protein ACK55Z_13185, partial [bacterium]